MHDWRKLCTALLSPLPDDSEILPFVHRHGSYEQSGEKPPVS
jgi:hypothetical protein